MGDRRGRRGGCGGVWGYDEVALFVNAMVSYWEIDQVWEYLKHQE